MVLLVPPTKNKADGKFAKDNGYWGLLSQNFRFTKVVLCISDSKTLLFLMLYNYKQNATTSFLVGHLFFGCFLMN